MTGTVIVVPGSVCDTGLTVVSSSSVTCGPVNLVRQLVVVLHPSNYVVDSVGL